MQAAIKLDRKKLALEWLGSTVHHILSLGKVSNTSLGGGATLKLGVLVIFINFMGQGVDSDFDILRGISNAVLKYLNHYFFGR